MISHWSGLTSAKNAHDVADSYLDGEVGDLDTVTGAPGPEFRSSELLLPLLAHRLELPGLLENLWVFQSVLLSSNINTSSRSDTVHGLVGVQLPKGREARAI